MSARRSERLPGLINPKPGEVPKSSAEALIRLEVQAHGSVHESWISHHVRIAEQLPDHHTPIVSYDAVELGKSLALVGISPSTVTRKLHRTDRLGTATPEHRRSSSRRDHLLLL